MAPPRSSFIIVIVFAVFLVLIVSCEDTEKLLGKYQADTNKNRQSANIFLELMDNGQGSWSTEEDSVSFKWEIRENEIWLHTKSGGVIVGKIVGETIKITLPALGEYDFKKVSCQIRRGQERRLFRFERP